MMAVFKYLWRNPVRSIPLLSVITLSVLVSAIVGTLVRSVTFDTYATVSWAQPFVIITANQPLPTETVTQALSGVKAQQVLPLVTDSLDTPSITGSDGRTVLGVPADGMEALLRHANWSISEGRLPVSGANEIVISKFMASALHLHLGSKVGNENHLGPLPGSESVVGILDTSTAVAFMPYDSLTRFKSITTNDSRDFLVLSNDSSNQLATSLEKAITNQPGLGLHVVTYSTMFKGYQSSIDNLQFLGGLFNGLTAVLLALAMVFLIMVYLVQRMSEFAARYILGFSHSSVLGLFMSEVGVIAVIGWFVALALYSVILQLLTPTFTNHGMIVSYSIAQVIPWTLPMPVVLLAASALLAAMRLRRLKAVQVSEGNY